MEKQILKAQTIIKNPSKNTKAKFVKTNKEELYINEDLIQKTTKLLGVKGYYTDLNEQELPTNKVIEKYHELYKVDQACRVAKSDLKTRSIFHIKEEELYSICLFVF